MMLYQNTNEMIYSADADADFFDFVAGVLEVATLAPCL